ncbi:MAG: DUF3883 domain-containing protein [Bacilli bacterium]|nr:DUF3883 domain-containing protein [Bacilli bacterium]
MTNQKNEQVIYIEKEIESVKKKYLSNAIDIISDFNNENKTKNDYKSRQIYELMQNADDCFTDECQEIKIKFILRDNYLIILNNGSPFNGRGVASLMHTDASSKYENTIGCKGLGFRSVLNWSSDISIYTKDFNVYFSETKAREQLDFYKTNTDRTHIDELNKIDRIAILCSASVDNDLVLKNTYLEDGYTTAVVLNCENKYIETIQNQLVEFQFEELLFLKHIRTIEIVSPKATRKIDAVKDKDFCGIEEGEKRTFWKVWSKEGTIPQFNGSNKKYELTIAYSDDSQVREDVRQHGFLYSYFKTDMPMPLPFLVHGTFDLSSERNKLVKENENNKRLLDILIDFIIEKSVEITSTNKCDYEALKFVIPSKEVYFLDSEYNFTNNIKTKIKTCKVFPSINGNYLSLEDKPRYSDNRFDLVVDKNSFSNLLIYCNDAKIREFIKECGISFYPYNEFCKLAVANGDDYIKDGKNVEIIKLYLEEYRYSATYGPFLLTDSDGKRICDKSTKIFNNPVNIFNLPTWSKMRFVNKELEAKLYNALNVKTGRELVNKLSMFNMEEYSFDRVVNELNKQCDSADKVKDFLKWLYESWMKNNQVFLSSLTNIDLKIVLKNDAVEPCFNCYFGIEYGNNIGQRLLDSSEIEPKYIADKETLGFSEIDDRTFVEFLEYIGVSKYPRIENIKLPNEMNRDYLEFNSKCNPVIYTDKGEAVSNDDFAYKLDSTLIKVDSIKGIDKILLNSDFEDIIFWILNDNDLYQHITSKSEINDKSSIIGLPKYKYSQRTIKKSYMSSWLKKVFSEVKWLNTKSGKKENSYNTMFADYSLSPVIETLNINYEKLEAMFEKRVKNEVDAFFENLGIVEDFSNLPKTKIYECLLSLPNLDSSDFVIGKRIYTQLNKRIDKNDIDDLIFENERYEEFKKDGLVLAKQNGKTSYMHHDEVFYVENKIYSNEILDKFPTLILGKRAGKNKVKKMFAVRSIDEVVNANVISRNEHSCNKAFQDYYVKLLPYIYSRRIAKDNKNVDLNRLKRTKIILVCEAVVEYSSGESRIEGSLANYELIYANETAFIKVPTNIKTIDQLKQIMDFRMAFAEVITTIFKVESEKDTYSNMLSCKDIGELEKYLKDDDENLVDLNRSKELFSEQINYENEFWNTLFLITRIPKQELKEKYGKQLKEDFDYNNPNPKTIIYLFGLLKIDVSDYNEAAFKLIHLEDYYKDIFVQLKVTYREQYFLNKIKRIIESNGFKQDFESVVSMYDFTEHQFNNSIKEDPKIIYEEVFGIQISELEKENGNLEELKMHLRDEMINEESEKNDRIPPSKEDDSEPIDYIALNEEIAENADDTVLEAVTEKPQLRKKPSNGKRKNHVSKAYDTSLNKKKELNGFIAESKVFNTLKKRIGLNGSVLWVSSNGEKAHKCNQGDDSLGYDIEYVIDGVRHYAEVKGTSGKNVEFDLSRHEYEIGDEHKESYEVWFVFIEEDGEAGNPIRLGNIFMFEDNESFFHNSRFSVEESEFKIRAKIKRDE